MTDEMKEILFEAFGDILEKMAFMFSEFAEDEEIEESMSGLSATMSYEGETGDGDVAIFVGADFAAELAENLLGYDESDSPEFENISHDALREVLNVVCGNLITTVYGEDPVFDLSVPVVDEVAPEQWKKLHNSSDTVKLMIDDSPAMATATVNHNS